VHIRNHAIKVLYGQCNRKIWYLVDVLAVFAATIIQNNVMWRILWLGQSIKNNSSKSTST